MNKCITCGNDVKNKYCNVSCQNKHQNAIKAVKNRITETYQYKCESCGLECEITQSYTIKSGLVKKRFCSRPCANKRNHSDNTKSKISSSLKNTHSVSEKSHKLKYYQHLCEICLKHFETKLKYSKCCSRHCVNIKGGRNSSITTNSRSKNEIYFSELCKNNFTEVIENNPMFNGWDADIIIPDLNIAILWNGKWHYEKITQKHSLLQVQTRDKIKQKEIKKFGYEPYLICDMGKYNKQKVEMEFNKFLNFISTKMI